MKDRLEAGRSGVSIETNALAAETGGYALTNVLYCSPIHNYLRKAAGRTLMLGLLCLFAMSSCGRSAFADLSVPAYTAYLEPEPEALEVGANGIAGWSKPGISVVWYGGFAQAGQLDARIRLQAASSGACTAELAVDSESHRRVIAVGATSVDFGIYRIKKPGYHRFALRDHSGNREMGALVALELSGAAAEGCRFNLKERRNAASVHLHYPVARTQRVTAFYNELTVRTTPLYSYYMACGFRRGYFGIQVNSPSERRVIFSVWDSGSEAVDRNRVADEDRVRLIDKGEHVFADSFGNEGTGGHSHLVYQWKPNTTYRFLVTSRPDGTGVVYSGYLFFPETGKWGLIATFRAPKDSDGLTGLYSFNENFEGANGHLLRSAEFGNTHVYDGVRWHELTEARFTTDVTGKGDRQDYDAFGQRTHFVLTNGGFLPGGARYNDVLRRDATGHPPADIPFNLLPH